VSKLPFVVAPRKPEIRRVGNAASGILEVPVLGGITVGEAAVASELLAMEQSSFAAGARLADAIAKEENISISEAFHIIESAVFGRELEQTADTIRLRHIGRIEDIAKIYTASGQRNMEATVTALLRCRLNLRDWSLEDTRTMHRSLFDDLWALVQEEQQAEDLSSPPVSEDDLKKPQPARSTPAKRTGRKSSTT
jgi:hypothetical protein